MSEPTKNAYEDTSIGHCAACNEITPRCFACGKCLDCEHGRGNGKEEAICEQCKKLPISGQLEIETEPTEE